ncbi:MAG TPA: CHAT domain-containing protein [Bryobacteraceae bacterium]|nr:CHAT domain-containing protein [Bryobacteraceae bacterium]
MPNFRAKSLVPAKAKSALESPFEALMREGGVIFRAGGYAAALSRFRSAQQLAIASKQNDLSVRATCNVGSCEFALHDYQAALHSYLDARRMADSAGDTSTVAVLDANIASLYAQMGEVNSAIQWLRGGMERLTGKRRSFLPQMQIEMGSLLIRQAILKSAPAPADQNSMKVAFTMFQQGIDGADRARNRALYAIGWNRLGEEFLRQNDLARAERAFLEAFRVRKLNHILLDGSYCDLGELRLAQGDFASASALLDRAVELSDSAQGPLPRWHVFDARGRVRLAQGRLREALDDLRIAVRLARAERWSAPAADAARIGAEGMLDRVHSDLIEAGNRLYFETRDPALVRETFEAAEENRANSLRQLVNGRQVATPDLPPPYWEAVARLQRAEVAALRSKDADTERALSAARAELVRMDAALIPDSQPLSRGLMDRAQATLGSDTALLSFHLGKSISWLWALDRASLMLYALPPRNEIEAQARIATAAIRENAPDGTPAGARLYQTLFGPLAPRFQRKTEWLLALDEKLLDVPIAALAENTEAQPIYVVERHGIQVIPGAGFWLESVARRRDAQQMSPVFVGVGDPIYNAADPRAVKVLSTGNAARPMGLQLFAASGPGDGGSLVLPRLVGSGSELDRCSLAWQGEHILLKGADASRRNLTEQLRRNPAVVHFATHFLESSESPSYGLIALSLTSGNETELLQPVEIANWKVHAGLVVLSGCHSGAGATLPGTGLLGLTRAWLMAGAQSVLASRWTTPDEEGDLFHAFYRTLSSQRHADPTEALRAAQLEMIRAGGWRGQPRYWGTYFVVGNQ